MSDDDFNLRKIAVSAFGPSFLFGLGEGAILPVIALSVRQLGGSVALAALMVTLIGIGSLVSNIPASLITTRYGERWAIVGAAAWSALGMALCVLGPSLARSAPASSWSAWRPRCSASRARATSPRRCRSAFAPGRSRRSAA